MDNQSQETLNSISTKKDKMEKAQGYLGIPTGVWIGILVVYLGLFGATGYVAFFGGEWNPAINLSEVSRLIDDQETKAILIEELKQDSELFKRRQELATQSFNIILGALLGFLSASATSFLRG